MKKRRFILAALVLLIAAIVAIALLLRGGQESESILTTGIVEGVEVNISTTVSGRILKECCKEGDTVKEGDTLIELESDDIRAAVEEAVAGLEKAEADVGVAESAVDGSKANIKSAEADIKKATRVRNSAKNREVALERLERLQEPRNVDEAVLKRILYGLSCRNSEACAESVPEAFGISPSTISRRFVKASCKLKELRERDLSGHDFVVLFIDGKSFAEVEMIIALGVTITGETPSSHLAQETGKSL